ncbi:MAG: helix-turn-helix domain-containing protein [Halanaerobiales bacterium]|nr:helix-turn-helix domain-containing protein [Halanaerobiales bacterium]
MKVYSTKQVADILNISDVTVLKLINNGELPAKKVARKWRITENQLRYYLEGDNIMQEEKPRTATTGTKLASNQTLESILNLEKEIENTYQDEKGFFIKLEGEENWYKLKVGEKLKATKEPDGNYKFTKVEK